MAENDCRNIILSEDYEEFIVDYATLSEETLESYNAVCYQEIDVTYSTVYVPKAQAMELSIRNYPYKSIPTLYGLMDTVSLEVSGILRLQNQPLLDLKGRGTIIGIIDTGINYDHKAFRDSIGRSRILKIWDQSDNSGIAPEGIRYGSEYSKEDIDRALASENPYDIVPQKDENGHGTFLAGVAAGSADEENDFIGAAPESSLVVVKLKPAKQYLRDYYFIGDEAVAYQENDIMIAIGYIRLQAVKYNMPASILIALGSNRGGHIGRMPISYTIDDFAIKVGSAISVAAGNEGNTRHHYSGQVTEEGKPDTIEIRVADNEKGFIMEIWGNSPEIFSVSIEAPTGEVIPRIPARLGESNVYYTIFGDTIIYVEYELVEQVSGDELILIRFEKPIPGIWKVNVYANDIITGIFNAWLPIKAFINEETYFLRPNPDGTITNPGDTRSAITISSYAARTNAFQLDSSRGFLRDGTIKPDVASPGVNVMGPGLLNDYTYKSGTSVAAAITTGAAALFLNWGIVNGNYKILSNQGIKSYLIRGATRERNIVYPSTEWGFGKLDVYQAFLNLRGR